MWTWCREVKPTVHRRQDNDGQGAVAPERGHNALVVPGNAAFAGGSGVPSSTQC